MSGLSAKLQCVAPTVDLRLIRYVIPVVSVLLQGSLAHAADLNDTGITFCGDASTNTAACVTVAADSGAYPRQDARFGRDAAAAAGKLTKVGGGEAGFDFTPLNAAGQPTTPSAGATPHPCVKDNVTGLIWEVKTADGGLRDRKWTYTWYDSVHNYGGNPGTASGTTNCKTAGRCDTEKYVADVNAAGLCGYSDWRMPTAKELGDIVHYGLTNPTPDPTYFPNTPDSLWSGSPSAFDPSRAFFVAEGYVGIGAFGQSRADTFPVLLVRGGQSVSVPSSNCTDTSIPASNPDDAYIDHGDGTVTDKRTGLMWKKCQEGYLWGNGTCTSTGKDFSYSWSQALDRATKTIFAGHSDWRLPNIKELRSLVEECRSPAINSTIFPIGYWGFTWSSTPITGSAGGAMGVWGDRGHADGYGRIHGNSVFLVRGGQSFDTFDSPSPTTTSTTTSTTSTTTSTVATTTTTTQSASFTLAVALRGSGSGTVTSTPAGIDCGNDCNENYPAGTRVMLTALPTGGSTLGVFVGACTGTAFCMITLDAAKNVSAIFTTAPFTVVTTGVSASGIVTDPIATVTTRISVNAADAGKTGAVYITAWVPASYFATPQRALAQRGTRLASASEPPAANPFVLASITPAGLQRVTNGQLIPYATGTLGDLNAAMTLLSNTDTTNLKGAEFCVGYGTSAAEMGAAGRVRTIATIPDPEATGTTSIGCLPLPIPPGWNLLGNGLDQNLAVANLYGDTTRITSVWKWETTQKRWAFYAPLMDAATLQNYTGGKGYGLLSEIRPGEGYWVNATAPASVMFDSGGPYTLTSLNLTPGWNLVATAAAVTPSTFNASLSATSPVGGSVPNNLTTLWTWDNPTGKWYFYAPSLEGQGGTALRDYAVGKGYLDFASANKTLGPGVGFWVNRP